MCLGSLFGAPSVPQAPAPVVVTAPSPAPALESPPQVQTTERIVEKGGTTVVEQTPAPQEQDYAVQKSREQERRRRLKAAEGNDTLITGGAGLVAPEQTSGKQLFGQ